jgi:hypothetical protein
VCGSWGTPLGLEPRRTSQGTWLSSHRRSKTWTAPAGLCLGRGSARRVVSGDIMVMQGSPLLFREIRAGASMHSSRHACNHMNGAHGSPLHMCVLQHCMISKNRRCRPLAP